MKLKQFLNTLKEPRLKIQAKILACLTLSYFFISSLFSYDVIFKGVSDPKIIETLQEVSKLEKLKESPPATSLGLKRRAEGDKVNILQALQSLAYYGAQASVDISQDRSQVTVNVDLGPVYPLSSFKIRFLQKGQEVCSQALTFPITLEDLGVVLGNPALPETILSAEDTLLDKLNLQGYAYAAIAKREVFADQETKHVFVTLDVEIGQLSYFGSLKITGLNRLKKKYFYRKLRWCQGDIYNPLAIEKTQEALELSGLFHSVNIIHGDAPEEGHFVPIEIDVVEGKQRSIGFGLNYTSSLGPGIAAEWEDRNIFGEGQKLSFRTNIWEKLQEGNISYVIPDFGKQNQNLIWMLDYQKEKTKSFIENSLAFSGTIERKIDDHLRISYGGMYKRLRSQRSDFNGIFDLFKIPLQLRWSNIDSILEPTKGVTLQFKLIPSFQIFKPRFGYCISTFTGTYYKALTENKRHVFAAKLMLGSIFGTGEHEIPPPERFYLGSESTLRGYRYLTVSPIGRHHKPIGGRSMFVYSMELRSRIGKDFGLVFFYDMGNAYKSEYPDFKERIRQSVGLGVRYYTPIGPLRLDLAFPLNKRRHLDHSLEAYFSIGQSF